MALPSTALCQNGIASWYGNENKKSSTGKKINHKTPAAAHRYYPRGSKIKITVLKTKKCVVAVVEDRGPYKKNRIVDVNKCAANELGIVSSGLAMVSVKLLSN